MPELNATSRPVAAKPDSLTPKFMAAVIAGVVFFRRHEAELEARAKAALAAGRLPHR